MAFELMFNTDNVGDGYGDGSDGDLTLTAKNTVINSYARVTAVNNKVLTLDNVTNAAAFKVGAFVLVQVVGTTSPAETYRYIGRWRMSQITAVDGFNITLKKKFNFLPYSSSAAKCQAIVVPQYSSVTLPANTSITCPQFNKTTGTGGVVAFMCSGDLTFSGGHIDLNGKGYPDAASRPLFEFEKDIKWTGFENTKKRLYLPLNYPDGAAFIIAKKITGNANSRIGNVNSLGEARTPMSVDSTKHGGASIVIAAGTFSNFNAKMISKAPSNSGGKGWSGCYIATETCLPCDEGLYAYDRISDENRLRNVFKIKSYGTAVHGTPSAKQVVKQLNSYAAVLEIDKTRKIFSIGARDDNGLAKFEKGALVMIRADRKSDGNYQFVGKFIITKIEEIFSTNKIQVETAMPYFTCGTPKYYNFQIVAIPQFADFTLASINSATPKYENGIGGIVAIAVNGTCDLSDGKLLVEGKGGCAPGNNKGLNYISNAQMAEKLPIGEGNGSVFILANNLIMNNNTRIGASWTGDAWGGVSLDTHYQPGSPTGYGILNDGTILDKDYNGSGTKGGGEVTQNSRTFYGGFNSNAYYKDVDLDTETRGANQGAHVLIIANKITGLNPAAISTGGQGGDVIDYYSAVYNVSKENHCQCRITCRLLHH